MDFIYIFDFMYRYKVMLQLFCYVFGVTSFCYSHIYLRIKCRNKAHPFLWSAVLEVVSIMLLFEGFYLSVN